MPVYTHLIKINLDQNMSCFNSKGLFHEKNIWTCKNKLKHVTFLKPFFFDNAMIKKSTLNSL